MSTNTTAPVALSHKSRFDPFVLPSARHRDEARNCAVRPTGGLEYNESRGFNALIRAPLCAARTIFLPSVSRSVLGTLGDADRLRFRSSRKAGALVNEERHDPLFTRAPPTTPRHAGDGSFVLEKS